MDAGAASKTQQAAAQLLAPLSRCCWLGENDDSSWHEVSEILTAAVARRCKMRGANSSRAHPCRCSAAALKTRDIHT